MLLLLFGQEIYFVNVLKKIHTLLHTDIFLFNKQKGQKGKPFMVFAHISAVLRSLDVKVNDTFLSTQVGDIVTPS